MRAAAGARQRALVEHRQPPARGRHTAQASRDRGDAAGAGLVCEGPLRVHLGRSGQQHGHNDAPPTGR
jgi:hypothetical protein